MKKFYFGDKYEFQWAFKEKIVRHLESLNRFQPLW